MPRNICKAGRGVPCAQQPRRLGLHRPAIHPSQDSQAEDPKKPEACFRPVTFAWRRSRRSRPACTFSNPVFRAPRGRPLGCPAAHAGRRPISARVSPGIVPRRSRLASTVSTDPVWLDASSPPKSLERGTSRVLKSSQAPGRDGTCRRLIALQAFLPCYRHVVRWPGLDAILVAWTCFPQSRRACWPAT